MMGWSQALSVGVESIDADHRLLFALMEQLDGAIEGNEEASVVGSVLLSLAAYTDYHFAREERVMAACGYPGLASHKELHDGLRAGVMAACGRFESDPDAVDLGELQAFLRDWLTRHILDEDMKLKPVFRANAPRVAAIGEAPLVDLDGIEADALNEELEWRI
ncbi:MAG: hemerythrin family protein [Alphaproteobacteria bacterium]|nr:hemerythrin family protein [Alphaproteobacteria bacterium]